MNIKKGESHRNLILPVLLILAAAFVATSLTMDRGNGVTGAATAVTGQQIIASAAIDGNRCKWFSNYTGNPPNQWKSLKCPDSFPRIAAGGCSVSGGYSIDASKPLLNSGSIPDGWACSAAPDGQGNSTMTVYEINTYCCKYNA
jgi:hypothetical protein